VICLGLHRRQIIRQPPKPVAAFSVVEINYLSGTPLSVKPFCTTKAAAGLSELIARLKHHTSILLAPSWRL
jgi:hypothetical protein